PWTLHCSYPNSYFNYATPKFQPLEINDNEDIVISFSESTFKLSTLLSAMLSLILDDDLDTLRYKLINAGQGKVPSFKRYFWTNAGVNCDILKPGKNWQKGKVRIRVALEFCPDEPEVEQISTLTEPESPLDDLRRLINKEDTQ
ncbi:MAG TPA: KGK domain-containing protein, partial [Nostocaceae cyanobacterium]|nr:KGK domain-containing protein [Nostocaceae cyanobacterium]